MEEDSLFEQKMLIIGSSLENYYLYPTVTINVGVFACYVCNVCLCCVTTIFA